MVLGTRTGEVPFGTNQLVVEGDVPSGDNILSVSHAHKVVFVERVVVRQKRVGCEGLVEADVIGGLQVAVLAFVLEAVGQAIVEGGIQSQMRMAHGTLAEIEVAIEGVQRVAELNTRRVECGVPYLVDLHIVRRIVEEEHLAPQNGIGCFLDVNQPFCRRSVDKGAVVSQRVVGVCEPSLVPDGIPSGGESAEPFSAGDGAGFLANLALDGSCDKQACQQHYPALPSMIVFCRRHHG